MIMLMMGNAKDVAMTPPKGHATMETTEKTKKQNNGTFRGQSDEEEGEEEEMHEHGKTIEIDVRNREVQRVEFAAMNA